MILLFKETCFFMIFRIICASFVYVVFIIFQYFLGIVFCIDFLRPFFELLPEIAPKMDPVWHARRRRKGARNGSRHASAAGPPFFIIIYCFGHPFGTILAPFWHLFSEKKEKRCQNGSKKRCVKQVGK